MGLFTSMNISASALTAQKLRLDLISNNIANINTTHIGETTASGNAVPYTREVAVFSTRPAESRFSDYFKDASQRMSSEGVQVAAVIQDTEEYRLEYDPDNPDAAKTAEAGIPVGYVRYPNVNLTEEMVDMISASRSYEANVTALNTSKAIALKALEIGKG
ncbi:flagellar basal body rod protein FlgC [Dehalobacter sp. DCM]|uniref:flagellar basal body rod protein FlgC n=1 Tax=Dehalobacter sp. DCM TaxID=2907827 RepID=UPI003081C550|nr:flagellar basal body rod protein FlgC [Dehalobacter sp. DCM]